MAKMSISQVRMPINGQDATLLIDGNADWNALQGTAGYIKNKTHGFIPTTYNYTGENELDQGFRDYDGEFTPQGVPGFVIIPDPSLFQSVQEGAPYSLDIDILSENGTEYHVEGSGTINGNDATTYVDPATGASFVALGQKNDLGFFIILITTAALGDGFTITSGTLSVMAVSQLDQKFLPYYDEDNNNYHFQSAASPTAEIAGGSGGRSTAFFNQYGYSNDSFSVNPKERVPAWGIVINGQAQGPESIAIGVNAIANTSTPISIDNKIMYKAQEGLVSAKDVVATKPDGTTVSLLAIYNALSKLTTI